MCSGKGKLRYRGRGPREREKERERERIPAECGEACFREAEGTEARGRLGLGAANGEEAPAGAM